MANNIFLQVVGFILSYIRNSFFLVSAMMIFAILVIIQIFMQDELGIDLLGKILVSLDSMPIVGGYIDIKEEMHVDGGDLAKFFFYLSFIFTILTEVVHYFRLYILKIKPRETGWADLKKRMLFVFAALTFMYIAAFGYVFFKTGDLSNGVFVFVIFWIISIGSTLLFFLFDFLTKSLRKIESGRPDLGK